jgi:hypothetical protein
MPPITHLTPQALAEVAEAVARINGTPENQPLGRGKSRPRPQAITGVFVAKTGGTAITARSSDTPGTGDVTPQRINDSGDFEAWDHGTISVKSYVDTASGTNAYVLCAVDEFSGEYLYIGESC